MKHFFSWLSATLFFIPLLSGQNTAIQGFIDQYKSNPEFTYAFLSKDLFEVATQSTVKSEDWGRLHQVVKNIGSLSILTSDSVADGISLYKEAKTLVPQDEFDELLTVRDGNDNVRIWVKTEETMVSDLILLVGSPADFVLICFSGNLELGNIGELASMFESAKVEQLAKTSEALSIDFNINPNPSNGQFNLLYPDEQDPVSQLSILDQNGRQLAQMSLSGNNAQQVAFRDLPAGIYWVQVKTQKGKIGIKQLQIVK